MGVFSKSFTEFRISWVNFELTILLMHKIRQNSIKHANKNMGYLGLITSLPNSGKLWSSEIFRSGKTFKFPRNPSMMVTWSILTSPPTYGEYWCGCQILLHLGGDNKIIRSQHITFLGEFTVKNRENNLNEDIGISHIVGVRLQLFFFSPQFDDIHTWNPGHKSEPEWHLYWAARFFAPKRTLIWHLLVPFKKAPKAQARKSSTPSSWKPRHVEEDIQFAGSTNFSPSKYSNLLSCLRNFNKKRLFHKLFWTFSMLKGHTTSWIAMATCSPQVPLIIFKTWIHQLNPVT